MRPVSVMAPTSRSTAARKYQPSEKALYSTNPDAHLFDSSENKAPVGAEGGGCVVHKVGKGRAPVGDRCLRGLGFFG